MTNWIAEKMGEDGVIHPELEKWVRMETRRQFLSKGMNSLGWAALSGLALEGAKADGALKLKAQNPTHASAKLSSLLDHAPKAKHVIYLHMVGGPPQMDLYDYKPKMNEYYDKDLPESVRNGQRLTTMTSGQTRFPIAPSKYKFQQHGRNGMWISELLPHTSKMASFAKYWRSFGFFALLNL